MKILIAILLTPLAVLPFGAMKSMSAEPDEFQHFLFNREHFHPVIGGKDSSGY